MVLASLSSLATVDREKISQRAKASLEGARARGRHHGRQKFNDGDRQKLRAALDSIPYSTVKKHARLMGCERCQISPTENPNG